MRQLRRGLYSLSLIGMVGYCVVCGVLLAMGRPPYPGQLTLILENIAGIFLISLPRLIERRFHIQFPDVLVVVYLIFMLMAILLGSGMQAYDIPYWDKIEHIFSAALLAGIGFMIYAARTPETEHAKIDPLLIAIFAATFGVTLGVLWEFYEFTGDSLLGMNMQRFMAHGQPLIGQAALYDTMGDLLMDVLGSVGLGVYGYTRLRRNPDWLATLRLKRRV